MASNGGTLFVTKMHRCKPMNTMQSRTRIGLVIWEHPFAAVRLQMSLVRMYRGGNEEKTKRVFATMSDDKMSGTSLYDFKVRAMRGEETIDLGGPQFRGKPVIVVNGASHCGYTKSNYEGLSRLMDKYEGLQVVVFPCNQFMNQERDDPETIACNIARYDPRFHVTEVVKVNGSEATPVFRWLKEAAPGTLLNAIKWNFTKFLVDREGRAVRRFAPNEEPTVIESHLEKLV